MWICVIASGPLLWYINGRLLDEAGYAVSGSFWAQTDHFQSASFLWLALTVSGLALALTLACSGAGAGTP